MGNEAPAVTGDVETAVNASDGDDSASNVGPTVEAPFPDPSVRTVGEPARPPFALLARRLEVPVKVAILETSMTGTSEPVMRTAAGVRAWLLELAIGVSGSSTPPIDTKEADAVGLVTPVDCVIGIGNSNTLARLVITDEI